MKQNLPFPSLLFLIALLGPHSLEAQDLSFLLPARTIDLTMGSRFRSEAFTGDYPYRLRAGPDQLALYTGIPLYFPLATSLGSVTQLAYKDDYSRATPWAVLSAGYQSRLGFLEGAQGPFVAWGWRWDGWAGGATYRIASREPTVTAGWFGSGGSLSASMGWGTRLEAKAQARWAFWDSFSLVGEVSTQTGQVRYALGLGTYLYEPPANSLTEAPWDRLLAHRGSLLRAPENTQPAVELALRENQVAGIELDVQRTSDGTYVFVHDDFLWRYNGTLERVVALSGRDLRGRDFGTWFSEAFAGTRPMVMEDLVPLAAQSSTTWVFDLKNVGTTEADARSFLSSVDATLQGAPAVVSTGDMRLLRALGPLSDYPLGLQVDVARGFFLFGDYFPPLLEWELESLVRPAGVTSFFLFSSKYANQAAVRRVADRLGVTFYLWNFHDRIFGRDPGDP